MMIDQTRSMELPNDATSASRWDVLRQMLEANRGKLAQLQQQSIEIKWFAFDNKLESFPGGELPWTRQDYRPTGSETDIGTSLSAAIRSVREQRLLASSSQATVCKMLRIPNWSLTRRRIWSRR